MRLSMSIINEVTAERVNQDIEWGGPTHDDKNDWFDWRGFLYKQMTNASMAHNEAKRRENLVKIAALAFAAIESMDRKAK
jgi:hypothetical protein